MISVRSDNVEIDDCVYIIVVPVRGIEEHGYIQTISAESDSNDKHNYHALSQMAYYQFQDNELDVFRESGSIQLILHEDEEIFQDGLVLLREKSGAIRAIFSGHGNEKKLIEAAFRFCTRWVRLDI